MACDVMFDIGCARQAALGSRKEISLVKIDISAVFDRESHSVLLFILRDV